LYWIYRTVCNPTENSGASVLVGNNIQRISKEYKNTLKLKRAPQRPALWDGHTAERCVQAIVDFPMK
jgi:UDP-N-acetylglucosamine 2-epimerase (non-hydrolysing)